MKAALVTGSSRGIGRSIALALADEGFNIIVNYSGNEQKAKQVVQAIIDKGQKAVAIKADVSNHEEVKSMIDQSVATFGSLDCIVNNAGITRDNLAMRMKREEFADVIDTNLTGVFNVIRLPQDNYYANVQELSSMSAVSLQVSEMQDKSIMLQLKQVLKE